MVAWTWVIRFANANADYSDEDVADDGNEGDDVEVGDLVERPRQGADEGDEEADDGEDDSAGAVVNDGVHHDGEGQDVRTNMRGICSAPSLCTALLRKQR